MRALTADGASGCIGAVKWLAVFLVVILECSCTTLVNRRDLYSPEPAPNSREMAKYMAGTTTTITTTTTKQIEEKPPPPEFRY